MSKILTINGSSFEFPQNNEDPNWAQDVTAWATEVTSSLNILLSSNNFIVGSESIDNNAVIPVTLANLIFSPNTVRAAHISYVVYRTSTLNPDDTFETGTMYLVYDTKSVDKWYISIDKEGDAGMSFSVDNTGQVSYISNDIGSSGYSGKISYSVKIFLQ